MGKYDALGNSLLRLTEMEVGTTWVLDSPKRICRVMRETTVEVIDSRAKPPIHVQHPAVQVVSRIVTVPIRGYATKRAARGGALISAAFANSQRSEDAEVMGIVPPEDGMEPYWEETWAERLIPRKRYVKNSRAIEADETDLVPQIYVYAMKNHPRKSGLLHSEVNGRLITQDAGIFNDLISVDEIRQATAKRGPGRPKKVKPEPIEV